MSRVNQGRRRFVANIGLAGCHKNGQMTDSHESAGAVFVTPSNAANLRLAISISALNASVTMKLSAGSAYTGAIEQYHEVNGFILAQKPSSIRVVGQAPVVGTNIFDMESDGKTFDVFIPSKNRFVTGPDNLERSFAKPIENLRP
jgi:hypothetical protein